MNLVLTCLSHPAVDYFNKPLDKLSDAQKKKPG